MCFRFGIKVTESHFRHHIRTLELYETLESPKQLNSLPGHKLLRQGPQILLNLDVFKFIFSSNRQQLPAITTRGSHCSTRGLSWRSDTNNNHNIIRLNKQQTRITP